MISFVARVKDSKLEIFNQLQSGIGFEDLTARSSRIGGMNVASLEDIKTMKSLTRRPKDLVDIGMIDEAASKSMFSSLADQATKKADVLTDLDDTLLKEISGKEFKRRAEKDGIESATAWYEAEAAKGDRPINKDLLKELIALRDAGHKIHIWTNRQPNKVEATLKNLRDQGAPDDLFSSAGFYGGKKKSSTRPYGNIVYDNEEQYGRLASDFRKVTFPEDAVSKSTTGDLSKLPPDAQQLLKDIMEQQKKDMAKASLGKPAAVPAKKPAALTPTVNPGSEADTILENLIQYKEYIEDMTGELASSGAKDYISLNWEDNFRLAYAKLKKLRSGELKMSDVSNAEKEKLIKLTNALKSSKNEWGPAIKSRADDLAKKDALKEKPKGMLEKAKGILNNQIGSVGYNINTSKDIPLISNVGRKVDPNKRYYHGTESPYFDEVDISKTREDGLWSRGFYNTDDSSMANTYIKDPYKEGAHVRVNRLKIENPVDMDATIKEQHLELLKKRAQEMFSQSKEYGADEIFKYDFDNLPESYARKNLINNVDDFKKHSVIHWGKTEEEFLKIRRNAINSETLKSLLSLNKTNNWEDVFQAIRTPSNEDRISFLKNLGFDGVIHTGRKHVGDGEKLHEVAVAWSNKQIKPGFKEGGRVPGYATGGKIVGKGTKTSDDNLIRASNKEYMMPADSAEAIGYDTLDYMRAHGKLPGFAEGTGGKAITDTDEWKRAVAEAQKALSTQEPPKVEPVKASPIANVSNDYTGKSYNTNYTGKSYNPDYTGKTGSSLPKGFTTSTKDYVPKAEGQVDTPESVLMRNLERAGIPVERRPEYVRGLINQTSEERAKWLPNGWEQPADWSALKDVVETKLVPAASAAAAAAAKATAKRYTEFQGGIYQTDAAGGLTSKMDKTAPTYNADGNKLLAHSWTELTDNAAKSTATAVGTEVGKEVKSAVEKAALPETATGAKRYTEFQGKMYATDKDGNLLNAVGAASLSTPTAGSTGPTIPGIAGAQNIKYASPNNYRVGLGYNANTGQAAGVPIQGDEGPLGVYQMLPALQKHKDESELEFQARVAKLQSVLPKIDSYRKAYTQFQDDATKDAQRNAKPGTPESEQSKFVFDARSNTVSTPGQPGGRQTLVDQQEEAYRKIAATTPSSITTGSLGSDPDYQKEEARIKAEKADTKKKWLEGKISQAEAYAIIRDDEMMALAKQLKDIKAIAESGKDFSLQKGITETRENIKTKEGLQEYINKTAPHLKTLFAVNPEGARAQANLELDAADINKRKERLESIYTNGVRSPQDQNFVDAVTSRGSGIIYDSKSGYRSRG